MSSESTGSPAAPAAAPGHLLALIRRDLTADSAARGSVGSVGQTLVAPRLPIAGMYHLDTMGGDATIIFGLDKCVFVDCGFTQIGTRMCALAKDLGLPHPAYVLLSHFDKDHFYGITAVLATMRPGGLVTTGFPKELWLASHIATCKHIKTLRAEWQLDQPVSENDLMQMVRTLFNRADGDCDRGTCVAAWEADLKFLQLPSDVGEITLGAGVTIKAIHNTSGTPFENLRDNNDSSVAWVCSAGEVNYFTAGDLEEDERYIKPVSPEKYHIVKCGHHGSEAATSAAFLQRVKPTVALLQGSHYGYGHPSPGAISRLADAHINIFSTNKGGTTDLDALRTIAGNATHAGDILTMVWDDGMISVFYIDNKGQYQGRFYDKDGQPAMLTLMEKNVIVTHLKLLDLTALGTRSDGKASNATTLDIKKQSETAYNQVRAAAATTPGAASAASAPPVPLKRKVPAQEKNHPCEFEECIVDADETCAECGGKYCAAHYPDHGCSVQEAKKVKRAPRG